MPKFKIYYGLGGSFGGAKYDSTEEFENENEAVEYAYDCAVQKYDSYAGYHGLPSYKEITEEVLEENPEADEDEIEDAYMEAIETWLAYKVELVEE